MAGSGLVKGQKNANIMAVKCVGLDTLARKELFR